MYFNSTFLNHFDFQYFNRWIKDCREFGTADKSFVYINHIQFLKKRFFIYTLGTYISK